MGMAMKTHLILMSTVAVLGASFVTTSYAAPPSEYLHFTRHRDSNGNLLMGATQHQAEPSVMQKTMMPAQPKMFERRSTDWGMSVQEVKENEPIQSTWELQSPVLADFERRVAYHTQIEGIEAGLTYTFYQDHLGQAKYVFEPQHEDAVEFVNDFHTVKSWVSQSYGSPTSSQEIWLDTLYQYDKSLWGQAIKRGHLVMVAEWKNPGTDIVLVLDGGDDTVGLVADFASTTFVVPVSLDTQSPEESVEDMVEETTIQEVLPAEPEVDSLVEDLAGQDMTHDIEGSGEFHPEAEVASQIPVSEMDELEEIEQMLNEEYPINAPLKKEFPLNKAIESSMDIQAPETARDMTEAMPLEPSIEESATKANPTDEPVLDMSEVMPVEPSSEGQAMEAHPTDKHATDHVIEAETELAPQHL
jgi:hypothetical protein